MARIEWGPAVTALAASLSTHVEGYGAAELAALESRLTEAFAQGQSQWPTVQLSLADYTRHLGERLVHVREPLAALDRWQHRELYLACGRTLGTAAAIEAFERPFIARIPAYTRNVGLDAAQLEELIDSLRERLLVGTGRGPKIAEYAGRGSLEGWVRIAAVRLAIDLARRGAPRFAPGSDTDLSLLVGEAEPEQVMDRQVYQRDVQRCLETAMTRLPREERAILKLYFVERLGVAAIGRLLHLDKSNVSRRLARARARILDETRTLLHEQRGLTAGAVQSVLRAVRSELHLSLHRLLDTADEPDPTRGGRE